MQMVNPVRTMDRTSAGDRSQASEAAGNMAASLVTAVEQFLQAVTPPGMSSGLGTLPGFGALPGPGSMTGPGSTPGPMGRHDRYPRCKPCGCGWYDPCTCGADYCGCQGRGCDRCRTDPCDCICCVGDVDLVVYTRLGEARVVPIEIHNPRRREREVLVELSDFTTKGGAPTGILAQIFGLGDDRTITLGPCETKELILLMVVGLPGQDQKDLASMAEAASEGRDDDNPQVPDVDDCLVAVADLRLVGCDIRPLRLAAAVLPRRCAAFEIDCRHGCC